METRDPTPDDLYEPPAINRFKVEAAMIEMIDHLHQQGLGLEEIALVLADAAEDYVLRLSHMKSLEDDDDLEDRHSRH